MISKAWEDRTSDTLVTAEALALIQDGQLLISRFGEWPGFEDAEILSMNFDRGNHEWVIKTGNWDRRVPPSLTASFYVFDASYSDADPRRRPSEATIRFEEFQTFEMDGFNYQNPIIGLSLAVQYSQALKTDLLFVNWGGTGMQHEVSFLCASARVLSVVARDGI